MAFKATQNRSEGGVFKATKRKSYDSTMVDKWKTTNESASSSLNSYFNTINNGGYLTSDDLKKYRKSLDDYVDTSNRLREVSKTYGQSYSEEDEKKWTDTINGLNTDFDNASKWYSQFGSKEFFEDYNIGAESLQKEIEELTTAKTEIGNLKSKINQAKTQKGRGNSTVSESDIKSLETKLKDLEGKYGDNLNGDYLARKRSSLSRINEMTEFSQLNSVVDTEDFAYYSAEGAKVKDASMKWETIGDAMDWASLERSDITNIVTFAEEHKSEAFADSLKALNGGRPSEISNLIVRINEHMKDDEKNLYNYYIGKGDIESANRYMSHMEDILLQREAGKIAEQVDDTALELLFSSIAGMESFFTGLGNIDNMIMGKDPDPTTSSTQYAYGQMSSNNDGIWGVANDLVNTTANMLPSILVGYIPVVGQAVGLASMSASASGNAYTEMKNLGYTDSESRRYALMVGASEGALQYALGGITKLGGKVSGNAIAKAVSKVDNAIARTALKIGGNMLSEGFEESIQSVLEPIFKSIVSGEDVDIDWGEVAYSGLLGALSAGLLEGGSTIAGEVGTYKQGKVIKESGVENVDRLKSLGSTFSADTVAYQLAGKVNENTGAYTIGRLLNEVGASLSEQNMTDITTALENKGMRSEDSQTIAKWLNKAVNGGYFNKSQVDALESNEIISEVFRAVVFDGNSTVNQRMQTYAELQPSNIIAKAEATEKATVKVLSKSAESNEVDVKSRISESGKTVQKSTGEAIVINKDNPIAKTEIVDGKRKVYYNTDKGKVDSADVSYANETEGLIHESFVDMGASIANAVIKNYDGKTPVQTYIKGMREGVILYGMHNFQGVGKDISSTTYFAELSKADQSIALRIGRSYASTVSNRAEGAIKSAVKKATEQAESTKGVSQGATAKNTAKKGTVRFENGAKASKSQRKTITLAKHLASATGIDIVFYDATIKGTKNSDANGYFDEKTDTIYLDLQNAENDAKTIVFTMSHELVHFIKKWSPAKFDKFAKFLMEQYAEHGVKTSELLANKMASLNTKDADLAYEEMIADACERMLLDSNAVMKLMELRKTDLTLFEKIKLYILELLNKIREAYKSLGYQPTSDEAKALSRMTDVLEQMYSLFEEASVEAVQNYQAVESLETEAVSMSEDGTIRMQMKQYQQTGRSTLLNYLKEQYGSDNANDLISTIDSIYDTLAEIKKDTALSVFGNWQDTDVELDANGHPIFTTSIKNGDYELNQDFSRVCKKRRQLNFVLNMLAEDPAFEASNLTKEDFVKINEAIKTHGFEIACALCFVDSKRFRQTEWADSFANTWNDILNAVVKDKSKLTPFNFATKTPNLADDGIEIDTSKAVTYRKWSDGKEDVKNRRTFKSFDEMLSKGSNGKYLEGNANVRAIVTLIRDNPSLRHTFRGADIIASDGFDSIQRLAPGIRSILDGWGGTSVPKPSSNDAIYDNSILNISGYNATKAFAVGGVRMNSFSDFMAHMFFDYAQAFADLSAKGLPMHSYTKELDFARLFGLTGGKINMSAIAAIRSNATDLDKIKKKADKDKATEFEKSIAGLDLSRLVEKLGKAESEITYEDVINNLDDVDYVWADESINVKSATLLQSGILYDNLTEGQTSYCYELIREGKFDEAFKVAGEANVNKGYAKHLGIITVGVSKAHILKLLRDPTIRMVIPYHKSGLNATIAKALKIAFYDDFTDVQNTTFKQGDTKVGITKDGAKIGGKNLRDFSFYDWFGKTIDGVFYDGKATASKYLEWCEKGTYDESVGDYVYYFTGDGGYILASDLHAKGIEIIPKFSEFASEENYYKVVEDFDCYDTITGEHSSQEAVDIFHDGLPSDYKDVLVRALKAEQKVSDDFKDHLDNKGLRDEVMDIVKARGYKPSTEMVVEETWGNIIEEVGAENISEATEQYTDVENTTRIKKQKKKTSDNTYENIGKELMYYEEGDLAPDLTLVETINDRTGKKEVTIKHHGQKPKDYVPTKIAYCYKLFEQYPDGSLHALFAGASNAVPIGEWRYAQGFPRTDKGVSGMNLRERYGWHLSAGLPSAPHLMSPKSFERGYPSKKEYHKGSKRVWVRMAYDASTDFNGIADSTGKENDIYGLIPFGGYYAFKENNQSEWVISSAVKIDKILKEEERQQILKEAGYDEYEAWRLRYQPTPEERAARELANKERQKAKARAKKLGIDTELTESTKAMRDSIKSRIIDNPELNGIKKQAKKTTTIDLTDDTDLAKLVDGVHGSSRYKTIANYILDVLGNEPITFSDGLKAIVDKRDAAHIASNAGSSKTRQIAKIKDLVTQAVLYAYDNEADHNKFNRFLYYEAMVRYDNEEFPLYLNVGRGLNDKTYHLYDITKKIRDTANRINGFERPKPNEGYALENDISDNKISQNEPIVKGESAENSENSSDGIKKQVKKGLTKADVENSFEVVWDDIVELTHGKYKNVKDFLRNYDDYEDIDYWSGMFDVVDEDTLKEVPITKVEGLWNDGSDNWEQEWTLGEVVEAYQNGTLDKFKFKVEEAKTPTTWREEAKAFYDMFYDQVSDSLKKDMPSFEEIMSYDWVNNKGFDPKSPMTKVRSLYMKMYRNLDKNKRDTLSKTMHSLEDLMRHHKVVFDYFNRYTDRPDLVYSIKKQAKKNTDRILMGSLFSGGGTLEAGLTYQMLDKEFGVEYDGKIASVYADNHGDHIQVGKVEDFDISKYKDIFYLHASPVCHNFSKAKHGAAELQMDKDSARATAMHLEMGMPQVFTVENAPGYLKSESLKIITDKLTELGYKWDADVYNSADYGSATSRNRVILRAVKDGELPPKPSKQERTNSWDKVTRDLWDTLPKSSLRPSFISAIENTPKLPILDANGKVNVNKPLLILTTTSGHTVTYCWEGEICPTLTTKCGEAKLVMPDGNIYAVTPKFMGRIQGLPDDYKYPKEKTRAFTIIGNGIPTHLTKAVVGGVLDSAYEQTHDGKVLYQKKKVSDRTILANALELAVDVSTQAGQNELRMLKQYQEKVDLIEKEEARLAEIKAEIYDISFTKGKDRSKLKDLNEEKIMTQNRIHTFDRQLTRLESLKPIKDVLDREKELVRKRTEEKGREALEAYKEKMMQVQKERIGEERVKKAIAVSKVRETRDKSDARTKLQKLVLDTVKWLTHPAKTDVKCPDMLKEPYAKFLNSIDLSSMRALKGGDATQNDLRVASAMESLATTIERIRTAQISEDVSEGGLDSGFLDLPGEFVTLLRDMAENIKKMMVGEGHTINRMTSTEIKQISNAIRTLNHSIKVMSELNANLRFANAQALGNNSMTFLDRMGEAKETNIVRDFVTWDNALPYYAFKKFGEGGESIMEELMDAQDKMAFHAQSILEFKEKTWTDKEAREWGEDTHTIELPSGNSITLTTANAMGIYCLARRDNEQGMNHLVGGGVRIVGLTKGSNKMKDTRVNLTYEDVNAIINSLSDRQKKVAETIQEFMSTDCAKWGNEISMKRFLTRDFVEKQYYPIESDNENLNTELPEASQGDLYRLLNISATKALTKGANNRVVIRDIFDVFTAHSSDMARLNAYGMALLDYMKWINYREKVTKDNGQIETRGVRQSMNSAYGGKALGYVMNLIKDINGRAGDAGTHPLFSKWAKAAKTASVGGNLRVALLQITAYPRAGMVLSLDSLAKGLTKVPQMSKARKYCGIALWKSFGFFDTNIARSIEDQIKGAKNIRSKIIELSMKGAEVADAVTWGALWNACEYEVAKTTKNKIGSEEFNYEVGKKLREVVYATQVVDSVLTRSQLMRSKDGVNQLLTAYMSEPTVTANILADAWWRVRNAKKLGLKGVKKHVGRVLGYYVTGAVFTTLMESLADAVRDDDEGEEFYEKFIEHFGGNLIDNVNPFNNIPYISDVIEAAKSLITGDRYYTSEMLQSQWITKSYYAINAWKSVFNGKGDVADALYKSAQAFSFITGIPISNVWRDIMAIWETAKGLAD